MMEHDHILERKRPDGHKAPWPLADMVERRRQQEAYELVQALEQLAVETGMKTRVVDGLRERKRELESPVSDAQWEKELLWMEETVVHIEKQLSGGETDLVISDTAVSREEVSDRIRETWRLCKEANRHLQASYRQTQAASRQKLEQDMMDWTDASVHYEMLSVPSRFSARCYEAGQRYKQQTDQLCLEYVDECAEEYGRAMNKIRGLVAALGGGQVSVTVRDIYEKWDSRREFFRQNARKSAEQLEKGESDLAELGQHSSKALEKVVSRKRKKRTFVLMSPILVVLVLLLAVQGISYLRGRLETQNGASAEQTAEEESGFIGQLAGSIKGIVVDQVSQGVAGHLLFIVTAVLFPSIILAAIIWILWVRHTRSLYRRWMTDSLGQCARKQSETFWQEGRILGREEECFRMMAEFMEQQYDGILRDLLGDGFNGEQDDSPAMRMRALRRKWNEIKYM